MDADGKRKKARTAGDEPLTGDPPNFHHKLADMTVRLGEMKLLTVTNTTNNADGEQKGCDSKMSALHAHIVSVTQLVNRSMSLRVFNFACGADSGEIERTLYKIEPHRRAHLASFPGTNS